MEKPEILRDILMSLAKQYERSHSNRVVVTEVENEASIVDVSGCQFLVTKEGLQLLGDEAPPPVLWDNLLRYAQRPSMEALLLAGSQPFARIESGFGSLLSGWEKMQAPALIFGIIWDSILKMNRTNK